MTTTEERNAAGRTSSAEYGSDLVAEVLRDLAIPYVSLNPGSSYRGIHDSLVNYGATASPELVLCNHESIAVAVAHGYARATDRPLAVALHNLVGLLNGAMAIYNAWCDRVPMIVLGGTGPVDAAKRRPRIDWVHTALIQGTQVRDYVKWDDQPASVEAIPHSLLKAYRIAMTEPKGPVYVNFDVELQEQALAAPFLLPPADRYQPPALLGANPEALQRAAAMLARAERPAILVDDVRNPAAYAPLAELAELLAAPVVSVGHRFALPSTHPMNLTHSRQAALADADVVLALDVFDLDNALADQRRDSATRRHLIRDDAKVISLGVDDMLEHSWAQDRGAVMPIDLGIVANSGVALPLLVELCRTELGRAGVSQSAVDARRAAVTEAHLAGRERRRTNAQRNWNQTPISVDRLYGEVFEAVKAYAWSIAYSGYGRAATSLIDFSEPEQLAGGGGRGSGLGQGAATPLGAALALKDSGRVCVSIVGDGELLTLPSALWTAANQRLPLLTIVNNNRSYGNDEAHQDYMARRRSRPVENRGVGIYIEEPFTDFVAMAKSFGVEATGAISDPNALPAALSQAAQVVARERRPYLVEVVTNRMER